MNDRENWNGEFYVNYHIKTGQRSWDEAVQYGFICAGERRWYSRTLEALNPSDRIWVNVPRHGYVGVGRVTGRVQRAADFRVTTSKGTRPVLDVVKGANYHRELIDDPDRCEYFVPVDWIKIVPLEQAIPTTGLFGTQNTVSKPTTPKWQTTVETLRRAFKIPKRESRNSAKTTGSAKERAFVPRLSARTFQRQFLRFDEMVRQASDEPFVSFREGRPAEWEAYKEEVRDEALRRLATSRWKRRDIGNGHILKCVIDAIEINDTSLDIRNNLVYWQRRKGDSARSHWALLKAKSRRADRRAFEQWFYDFFRGRLADEQAFETFRDLAGNRYDLVAYLFFLKDSERFMPIHTGAFDEAFRLLDIDLVTGRRCSWENYCDYNRAILEVRRALREVVGIADARLLDAHSFCWMLVRLEPDTTLRLPTISAPVTLASLQPAIRRRSSADNLTEFDIVDDKEFAKRDAARRRLGKRAQFVALRAEQMRLREAGCANPDEAAKQVWNEPARGYDILSCNIDGTPRHIEVKASRRSGDELSFIVTRNEWEKSRSLPNYHFYLVLKAETRNPIVYAVESDKVSENCIVPMNYLASFRPGKSGALPNKNPPAK